MSDPRDEPYVEATTTAHTTPDPQAEAVERLTAHVKKCKTGWSLSSASSVDIETLLAAHATLTAENEKLRAENERLDKAFLQFMADAMADDRAAEAENEKLRGKVGELEAALAKATDLARTENWHAMRATARLVDSRTNAEEALAAAAHRAEAAEAQLATALRTGEELREALKGARPLVEKWCHYQGNTRALFDEYIGPIDAALNAPNREINEKETT